MLRLPRFVIIKEASNAPFTYARLLHRLCQLQNSLNSVVEALLASLLRRSFDIDHQTLLVRSSTLLPISACMHACGVCMHAVYECVHACCVCMGACVLCMNACFVCMHACMHAVSSIIVFCAQHDLVVGVSVAVHHPTLDQHENGKGLGFRV